MKLLLAPSAQTHTSIAVVWDKPEDAQSIEEYVLYLNGREAARVKETDYTFENLTPDTEYTIRLGAVTLFLTRNLDTNTDPNPNPDPTPKPKPNPNPNPKPEQP